MNRIEKIIKIFLDKINYQYNLIWDKKLDYIYKLNGESELIKIHTVKFMTKIFKYIFVLLVCTFSLYLIPDTKNASKIIDNEIKIDDQEKRESINVKLKYNFLNLSDEKEYEIPIPKRPKTSLEKVDDILNKIDENVIKGDNANLNQIKSKLFLTTSDEHDSQIYWESDSDFIDASTGKVCQPYKGEGNKKVKLKVYVKNGEIKKVKEFNVTVLENEKSKEDLEFLKLQNEVEELIKNQEYYTIKNEKAEFINQIGDLKIEWNEINEEKSSNKLKFLIIIFLVFSLLIYKEYKRIDDIKKKMITTYEMYLPIFIEQFIILLSVGFNTYTAFDYITKTNIQKSKNSDFIYGIIRINNKVVAGVSFKKALEQFGVETDSQIIKKFVNNLIYNMERGDKELSVFLQAELKNANNNSYNIYMNKAKEDNIKMIFPLILNFIAVVIIVVYPAISNLKI